MKISSRFERKYRLTLTQYLRVRNSIQAFMKPDPFAVRRNGSYLVRSLYFDTAGYDSFYERIEGYFDRIKLRLRVYTDIETDKPKVLVEMKTKKGNVMEKYSSFTSYSDYLNFMKHGSWTASSDPVLAEFERLYRVRDLQPTLLVQYHREAYLSRDGRPIRVTLDHNVHSSRARVLFPRNLLLKPHRPKYIVLEIKTTEKHETDWLRRIVRYHSLKRMSNSKYVQGIEIVRPYMVTRREVG
ncbi:MAG: polyphosphate polymerase domain-containing protein [Spirochaetia bacterium]